MRRGPSKYRRLAASVEMRTDLRGGQYYISQVRQEEVRWQDADPDQMPFRNLVYPVTALTESWLVCQFELRASEHLPASAAARTAIYSKPE